MFWKRRKKLSASEEKTQNVVLTKSLEKNISIIENTFCGDETLVVRRFQNKYLASAKCCVLYFDKMADCAVINKNILEPILADDLSENIASRNLLNELQYKVISANNVKNAGDLNAIISALICGDAVLLVEGYDQALLISAKGWQMRAITEPDSDKVVRGPREGFTESIAVNLSLIKRKIASPDLKLKFMQIGERTHTRTCICYIRGLAAEGILKELERRLQNIQIDAILDSGYIQELIKDAPFSPFETVGYSEKPDVIASKLLEGRIALFVDGSPVVLTVPHVLAEAMMSSEDYYNNFIIASFNRILRSTSTFLSISVPAVYLSLVTFHHEMIPTPLLLSISASRQGVPFPTSISLILMLLVFDILREAGTRMPAPISQAVNIVGTLVLGQAAVEARLVSAPVVIVTALTGILTLMNVKLLGPTVIARFFLLIAASVLGIYGYIFGFLLLIIHMMTIRSFGVPYLLGLTRVREHDGQDGWIRVPWWSMTLRPKIIAAKNLVRQSTQRK